MVWRPDSMVLSSQQLLDHLRHVSDLQRDAVDEAGGDLGLPERALLKGLHQQPDRGDRSAQLVGDVGGQSRGAPVPGGAAGSRRATSTITAMVLALDREGAHP